MNPSATGIVLSRGANVPLRSVPDIAELLSGKDVKMPFVSGAVTELHEPAAVSSEDLDVFYHHYWNNGSPKLGIQSNVSYIRHEARKYVLAIRGLEGIIFDESGISKDDGYFWAYPAGSNQLDSGIHRYDDAITISDNLLRSAVEVNQPLIVTYNGNAQNYYHICETAVALDTLATLLQNNTKIFYPRSIDRHTNLNHRGFLANLGYFRTSLLRIDQPIVLANEVYWLENYLIEQVGSEILCGFRERMFARFGKRRRARNRIYIRRSGTRSIINASALEKHLVDEGFAIVDLERVSFGEQIRLFQDAEVVVGAHGAGLVNILFSPETTAVVELVPSCEFRPFFWMLAEKLGQRYGLLSCPSNGFNEPMQVDVPRLSQLINTVRGSCKPMIGFTAPSTQSAERRKMAALEREDVEWCYRTLLHRQPESQEVVTTIMNNFSDLKKLVPAMLASQEYRRIRGLSAFLGDDIVVQRHTKYGFTFSVDLSITNPPLEYILFDYELAETDFIYGSLAEGLFCVDAGARHGWITCVMAAKVGRGGKVYAFDPDRGSHPVLMSVVAENRFHQVEVLPLGLSNRSGRLNFRPASATLRSDAAIGGDYEVEIVRLDDLLATRAKPISFIKMDIEGHEWPALQGAAGILRQDRPTLLIELNEELSVNVGGYSTMAMIGWLTAEMGYVPIGWDGSEMAMSEVERMIAPGQVRNLALKAR